MLNCIDSVRFLRYLRHARPGESTAVRDPKRKAQTPLCAMLEQRRSFAFPPEAAILVDGVGFLYDRFVRCLFGR